jgi:DNA-binding transcriptional regulator YiaG
MPARPIKEERQRWYVYLLLKHFKGDTSKFSRTMDISKRSIETWKEHHYDDMKEFIKKERKCDRNGGEVPIDERETPEPETLKEQCLKRMEEAIKLEQDPAKLARTYETLDKMINPTEKGKEKKTIAEAVLESTNKK